MTRDYHFEDYDPSWTTRFNTTKDFILSVFKDKIVQVEHVGSTSIPGMRAKPIIDAVVIINPYTITANEENIFLENGYYLTHNRIADNSAIFEKGPIENKTENIHMLPIGHFLIDQMVLSRDYLRTHPQRVKEYSDLKNKLKQEYPNDYALYRKGKEAFMQETAELAKKEYNK